MMKKRTRAQRELLGALVGLARALDASNESAAALRAIVEALRICGGADEAELRRALEAVRAEKRRAVPDCAVCQSPCGRTADYDLDELERLDPALAALKEELLDAAVCFAQGVDADAADFRAPLEALAEALHAVGYDAFSAEELRAKIEKISRKNGGPAGACSRR